MSYIVIDLRNMKMYSMETLPVAFTEDNTNEPPLCMNSVVKDIVGSVPMICVFNNGTINNNIVKSSENGQMNAAEEKVKQAILNLLEATDENENKIFTEKGQWYAIYKVLSKYHGYPRKISEFCDIMVNWGMDKVTPACSYESVKKVPTNVPEVTNDIMIWHNLQTKAKPKFKKQISVAMKLTELLE